MSQLARNPSNFSSMPNPNVAFDTLICAPEPRKSFRSLLTVLLFKVFFYHGMFCVGMHRFNGSLHNSASVTHGFSDNTRFKHPSRILSEEPSCTKLQLVEIQNIQTVMSMKLPRQLKGCAQAAACKRLRYLKSLYHCRGAQ